MADSDNSELEKRYQSLLQVHLKQDELDAPKDEQIAILEKKNRKQSWFLAINIAAIIFFGYSFYYGITRLGNTLLYILCGVFVINLVLIFYQKKQLRELIEHLTQTSGSA